MKYVKQVLVILAFTALGELLAALIPFPIPAAIYGIVLMLIALGTGVLKTEAVKEAASFLTGIMPILFVPPAVRILEYWGIGGDDSWGAPVQRRYWLESNVDRKLVFTIRKA